MKHDLLILVSVLMMGQRAHSNIAASWDTIDTEKVTDSPLYEELEDPFRSVSKSELWREPSWKKHEEFQISTALRPAVNFWISIYSKYPQDKGVIHDSENLDLIYYVVDFSDINRRSDIHRFRKEHLRKKRVEESKDKVISAIKKISKVRDVAQLNEFEKIIFSKIGTFITPVRAKELIGQLRFQLGQKDKMIQGIYFSGRYLADYERLFDSEGLPLELTRLPFVESSFNVMARSKVGASGLWQLMPSVLTKSEARYRSIDLRNFPPIAAQIAARVLKQNYQILKSWPLAVTAYNHGPGGVLKLIKLCRSRRLEDLMDKKKCQGKRLGFASRNFFPSFLAALEVETNAMAYFGKVYRAAPLKGRIHSFRKSVSWKTLAEQFGQNHLLLTLYNPHVNYQVTMGRMMLEPLAPVMLPTFRNSNENR
ncbi:MAG: lytic transglycosylase domain-containing protein [Bdellovibrionaceae bacterium]|nr:lytic transglycosylase domain-containing protein [Pseudobdellovibrionaceae bacterium]MDW8190943.1 lytic transglycosylase domain-containing protein [Pseudobdellovibrionaceae bacterium]